MFAEAISSLSTGYSRLITWVAGLNLDKGDPEGPLESLRADKDPKAHDLEQLDAKAVAAAHKYRGTGVAIALLGLGVVVAELLAGSMGIGAAWQAPLQLLKLLLMACVLMVAIWAIRSDLRGDFIRFRAATEEQRFKVLLVAANELKLRPLQPERESEIESEIDRLLQDQYDYQTLRARKYRAMTWISNRLTWLLFGLAMVTVGLECVARGFNLEILRAAASIGTMVTIVLAVLAAIQSINAFLRLEGQRHEARTIAEFLGEYISRGEGVPANHPYSPEALSAIYKFLMSFEEQWVAVSSRSGEFKP